MNFKTSFLSVVLMAIGLVQAKSLDRRQNRSTNPDGSITTTTVGADGSESWVTETPAKLNSVSRSGPIPFPGVRQLANTFGVSNSRFDELINEAAKPVMAASEADLQNRINGALNSANAGN